VPPVAGRGEPRVEHGDDAAVGRGTNQPTDTLREQRGRLSRSASVAEPIDYMLKRWDRFARFIDDGRICLTNNAAERALRGLAASPGYSPDQIAVPSVPRSWRP